MSEQGKITCKENVEEEGKRIQVYHHRKKNSKGFISRVRDSLVKWLVNQSTKLLCFVAIASLAFVMAIAIAVVTGVGTRGPIALPDKLLLTVGVIVASTSFGTFTSLLGAVVMRKKATGQWPWQLNRGERNHWSKDVLLSQLLNIFGSLLATSVATWAANNYARMWHTKEKVSYALSLSIVQMTIGGVVYLLIIWLQTQRTKDGAGSSAASPVVTPTAPAVTPSQETPRTWYSKLKALIVRESTNQARQCYDRLKAQLPPAADELSRWCYDRLTARLVREATRLACRYYEKRMALLSQENGAHGQPDKPKTRLPQWLDKGIDGVYTLSGWLKAARGAYATVTPMTTPQKPSTWTDKLKARFVQKATRLSDKWTDKLWQRLSQNAAEQPYCFYTKLLAHLSQEADKLPRCFSDRLKAHLQEEEADNLPRWRKRKR
ncbi:hypothetical protein [Thermosporothrix hazakensis]|uniref:hypothetical protein n=1 Tax=Thermosporothrix hazakensis TaxID=644383 RepID=UPI0010F4CED7|nr:hypothetical protein [Thermosporothrix hazakensis]